MSKLAAIVTIVFAFGVLDLDAAHQGIGEIPVAHIELGPDVVDQGAPVVHGHGRGIFGQTRNIANTVGAPIPLKGPGVAAQLDQISLVGNKGHGANVARTHLHTDNEFEALGGEEGRSNIAEIPNSLNEIVSAPLDNQVSQLGVGNGVIGNVRSARTYNDELLLKDLTDVHGQPRWSCYRYEDCASKQCDTATGKCYTGLYR